MAAKAKCVMRIGNGNEFVFTDKCACKLNIVFDFLTK